MDAGRQFYRHFRIGRSRQRINGICVGGIRLLQERKRDQEMKKWLWAAAAALIAIGFAILSRDEKAAVKAGAQRDALIKEGSGRAKAAAHKAGIKADRHQENAVEAAKVGQAVVDKVGKNNEGIRDVLDGWRSDRVQ